MIRYLFNRSLEPIWRAKARDDAEKLKHDLTINRRKFLSGAGVTAAGLVAIDEYIGLRRAVAGALTRGSGIGSGPPPTVTHITNMTTGVHYDFIPDALVAMSSGDTILLPAGNTYLDTSGATKYYADYRNTDSTGKGFTASDGFNSMFMGVHTDPYNGMLPSADYGSLTGVGTANNGRAVVTPPYGILLADLHNGDTVVQFDSTIPVACWRIPSSGTEPAYITSSFNLGQFANDQVNYTGVDIPSNSLTGVDTSGLSATVPAGTLMAGFVPNGQGPFVCFGQNPGWSFTNLEIAYCFWAGGNAVMSPIRQGNSFPGQPQVGSMTVSNCYLHDCRSHAGIGYTGIGPTPTFAHLFDTELYQLGAFNQTNAATHNLYIGHMGELICDNVYSHKTNGTWLIKSRANFNFIRYCQIIGERTDANPGGEENSGCDFSNGGLTYFIGNLCQQSLNAANQQINYNAEWQGPLEGGATNATQEIYVVNSTLVGPSNGTGNNGHPSAAPIKLNGNFVQNPEITLLSQSSGGSLPARQYWVSMTLTGTSGGETTSSVASGDVGGGEVLETLPISSSSLLNVASPMARTGAAAVNYRVNYADPQMFLSSVVGSLAQTGNFYFWDAGNTQPIFSTTSGGVTISATGTATNGSRTITGLTSLVGVGSIAQLRLLSVYSSGSATTLSVSDVDVSANTLTLNDVWSGSTGSASLTFGYYLYIGVSYSHSLGDSITGAMMRTDDGRGAKFGSFYFNYNPNDGSGSDPWVDGSYTSHSTFSIFNGSFQVPPGQKLIVNAPPSGPSWATGINVWALPVQYTPFIQYAPDNTLDANILGLSKLSASPTAFGSSWTSPAGVMTKGQQQISPGIVVLPNLFLQNASPISIGTSFVEPTSGLVNHNPTQNQLLWQRLGAIQGNNGGTLSVWIAEIPSPLTSYVESVYAFGSQTIQGNATIWRGIDTSNPYDTNFLSPVNVQQQPVSVNTASTHDTVVGAWKTNGTSAGSGFTLASLVGQCLTEYAQFSTAQSGLSVSVTGGGSQDLGVVLALHGSSSAPTLVGSAITINTTGATATFTVPSASTGDYIVLCTTNNIYGVGQIGVPCTSSAVGISPLYQVQNCIAANFNPATLGSDLLVIDADTNGPMPGGYGTEVTNLYCNPFNGSSFGSPTWATVFSDATQSDFVYALASSSPALNAASDPGSSPESQNLAPAFQSGFSGLPTPGTPIPPKVARSDIGPAKTGSIGGLA